MLTTATDFEPIHEDGDLPRDIDLFLYEEYSRRELPQMFRGAIETIVNEETQPLEEELRGQLTALSNNARIGFSRTICARSLPVAEADVVRYCRDLHESPNATGPLEWLLGCGIDVA